MKKPVVLTGLRANNDLTFGNYFGGILPTVEVATKQSDAYQVNLFVPDLHSFTTSVDFSSLQKQIRHNLRIFVAAGLPLDDDNVFLYRQSYIPAHSELTWILDCFASVGELNRMTQFKDKTSKIGHDRVSMGLFNYPVLMAADILLYNSSYVPVGDDQTQHLEFTRDIAERMNNKFGDLFVIPEPVKKQHEFFSKDQGLRIMDLHDPTKKMSKSDDSGKGVIFLNDDPEISAQKIMAATTDTYATIQFNRETQPGISNLLEILSLLTHRPVEAVAAEWRGKSQYGEFKKVVAAELTAFLTNFQDKLSQVDDEMITQKLENSEQQLAITANDTLLRVQKAIGIR
jgi:tryptophanyl-tRNA synthetase